MANQSTEQFAQTILAHLQGLAETDEQIKTALDNPEKSIEECCRHIVHWVQAQKSIAFTNAEVFGQAIHYYIEDDIKVAKEMPNVHIIESKEELIKEEAEHFQASLTPDEIAAIRKEAKERLVQQEIEKRQAKPKPSPQAKTAESQLELFAL